MFSFKILNKVIIMIMATYIYGILSVAIWLSKESR